eukprot:881673-Prorocentrum_lima.AAC.1
MTGRPKAQPSAVCPTRISPNGDALKAPAEADATKTMPRGGGKRKMRSGAKKKPVKAVQAS